MASYVTQSNDQISSLVHQLYVLCKCPNPTQIPLSYNFSYLTCSWFPCCSWIMSHTPTSACLHMLSLSLEHSYMYGWHPLLLYLLFTVLKITLLEKAPTINNNPELLHSWYPFFWFIVSLGSYDHLIIICLIVYCWSHPTNYQPHEGRDFSCFVHYNIPSTSNSVWHY